MSATATKSVPRAVGRYVLFEEIARGGMATVHLGRLRGPAGFKRTVAIKRLHAEYARNPEFVTSFLGEAQLAARILHPNVVPVLDVVAEDGELFLVMEYVHGESLANLLKASRAKSDLPPPAIVAQIMTGVLYGLHAAHEARSDRGVPLKIVHRDVSPQNVLVGSEGVARVLDFGVAKAAHEVQQTTKEGIVKGKLAYMPPEQLESEGSDLDRRVDVYAAAVVFWEALTGRRLFDTSEIGPLVTKILTEPVKPPSSLVPGLPAGLDAVVMKGLQRKRENRYATAMEMARGLEKVIAPIPIAEVSEWVHRVVDESLRHRTDLISKTEKISVPPPSESLRASMPDSVAGVLRSSSPEPDELSGLQTIVEAIKPVPADLQAPQTPPRPLKPPTLRVPTPTPTPREPREIILPAVESDDDDAALAESASRLPRSKIFTIAVVVSIVSLAVIAYAVIRNIVAPAQTPATVVATPTASSNIATAAAAASSAAASSAPTASTATGAAAASSSTASSSADPPAVPSSIVAGSPHPAALAAPKSTPTATARRKHGCDPPWTLDARGVRVLKRECL